MLSQILVEHWALHAAEMLVDAVAGGLLVVVVVEEEEEEEVEVVVEARNVGTQIAMGHTVRSGSRAMPMPANG